MSIKKNPNQEILGKMLIANTLKIEEELAGLIKLEVKAAKKRLREGYGAKEIQKSDKTIRYIIYALITLDNRIDAGMELIRSKTKEHAK